MRMMNATLDHRSTLNPTITLLIFVLKKLEIPPCCSWSWPFAHKHASSANKNKNAVTGKRNCAREPSQRLSVARHSRGVHIRLAPLKGVTRCSRDQKGIKISRICSLFAVRSGLGRWLLIKKCCGFHKREACSVNLLAPFFAPPLPPLSPISVCFVLCIHQEHLPLDRHRQISRRSRTAGSTRAMCLHPPRQSPPSSHHPASGGTLVFLPIRAGWSMPHKTQI